LSVKDFFVRIWGKKKKWQSKDLLERREIQLRWLKARHEVSQHPAFIQWLESLAIDYFQLGKQIKPGDSMGAFKVYYEGMYDAVAFIIDHIEKATDERIKIETKELEEKMTEFTAT
jgi:hypothetical protein